MAKPYADLVAQAEKAVAGVKDGELKRVAFERVLNDLLAGDDGPMPSKTASKTNKKKKRRAPSSSSSGAKKRAGPQAYVEEMAEDSFFDKPRTISEVKAELENRGHHIPLTSLSGPMQKLCQKKVLRRHKADGKTFSYSNW